MPRGEYAATKHQQQALGFIGPSSMDDRSHVCLSKLHFSAPLTFLRSDRLMMLLPNAQRCGSYMPFTEQPGAYFHISM